MLKCDGVFVDGAWQKSTTAETFTVIDPHSEEPYGETTLGNAEDVDTAVCSAERAMHGEWASSTLEERCQLVLRIRDLLQKRREELATIQSHSMGGLYKSALFLGGSIELIDMYVDSVRRLKFEYLRRDSFGNALITRRPVGVVAGIVPWNAPVRSEVKKTIPALLSGCSIVLKPAPETPFGAAIFAETCYEAGVPAGVVNLVSGGAQTGEELVKHPKVRKIAFTGSSATGARIAEVASPAFKRLQLELGGKSAAIVLDDVDLRAVMAVLVAGNWANSGQACTAITRVLAPRNRYDEVVDAFIEAAEEQVVGDPMDPTTTLGPLLAKRQQDRVLGYIASGIEEGASLAVGGTRPPHLARGHYVLPTVFTKVSNSMKIAREEIFGPVTLVIPYDDENEAVEIANDSDYGLHGGVFSSDEQHALSVAERLDTGSVGINMFYLPSSAPFGGIKGSGIGREHGPEGFDSFLEYISYNITPSLAEALSGTYPAG
jgi:betaine-aldehyde dehydrogenase